MGDSELTAADLARMRGWTRWKAWRWLRALETEFGASVVQRRGRALFTTEEGLKRVALLRRVPKNSNRVAALESSVVDLQARLEKQERLTLELRRELAAQRGA